MNQNMEQSGERPVSRGQRFKAWLLRDFGRKLVALALAALLYGTYSKKTDVDETFTNVPVTLDLPADLICQNAADTLQVSLTVSGDKNRLRDFDPSGLRLSAKVDVNNFVPGQPYTLRLWTDNVQGLPRHLTVNSISPHDLKLNLEQVVTKQVPVSARYDSESALSQDYKISDVRFVPATVTISGPATLLSSVNAIYTQPIPIDGKITESFDYRIGLRVPEGIQVDRTQVDAQVEIVKAFVERIFTSVPLLTVQSAEHTRQFRVRKIVPDSVTVTLRGPKEIMVKLPSEEITAFLNINSVKKAGVFQMTVNPMLETPQPGVSIKSIQPAVAEVTVECE